MEYTNINKLHEIISMFDKDMKIFLDVDGVVIQSVKAMCQILNEEYGTNVKPIEILSWNFNEIDKDITSDEVEDIFSSNKFFDIVEFYDGIIDFIDRYRNRIIFCTKGNILNIEGKIKLFKNRFNDIPLIGLPLNVSKGLINMENSLFIDDCSKNLKESNAMIKILFREFENDAEWQRGWNGFNWNGFEMKSWIM